MVGIEVIIGGIACLICCLGGGMALEKEERRRKKHHLPSLCGGEDPQQRQQQELMQQQEVAEMEEAHDRIMRLEQHIVLQRRRETERALREKAMGLQTPAVAAAPAARPIVAPAVATPMYAPHQQYPGRTPVVVMPRVPFGGHPMGRPMYIPSPHQQMSQNNARYNGAAIYML
jgi:hypothetical protein